MSGAAVYFILEGVLSMSTADIINSYGHLLIEALGQTLLLALYSLFFACIIGLIFGIMSVVKNRFCRAVSFVFVYAIRRNNMSFDELRRVYVRNYPRRYSVCG